jgi:hypothetical protein
MIVSGIALALSACASAPPRELSILEAIDAQSSSRGFSMGPQSCAGLDTASVCVKSSRLEKSRECSCADLFSITDGKILRF